MDKRAKVTIFIGLGVFAFGIFGMIIGAIGIGEIEEQTQFALEDVTNGTIVIDDKDGIGDIGVTFWVKGKYIDADENGIWDVCDSVEITVTENPEISDWGEYDGGFYSEVVFNFDKQETSSCESDGLNKDNSREEQGFVKIGRACFGCFAGNFTFESNANVSVTYDDQRIEEMGGGIRMIVFGFLGGSGAICCGVVLILIGIILVFTLKEDAPVEMQIGADGTYMMATSPENTVGVGVTQSISQVNAIPVVTEEMTKAEPYQFPATESSPEDTEK